MLVLETHVKIYRYLHTYIYAKRNKINTKKKQKKEKTLKNSWEQKTFRLTQ